MGKEINQEKIINHFIKEHQNVLAERIEEHTKQWLFMLKEWRDGEKYKLDKMDEDNPAWEWQKGRWSVLCDLIKTEFKE